MPIVCLSSVSDIQEILKYRFSSLESRYTVVKLCQTFNRRLLLQATNQSNNRQSTDSAAVEGYVAGLTTQAYTIDTTKWRLEDSRPAVNRI